MERVLSVKHALSMNVQVSLVIWKFKASFSILAEYCRGMSWLAMFVTASGTFPCLTIGRSWQDAKRLSETNPTPRTDLLGLEMQMVPDGRSYESLIPLVELKHIIAWIVVTSCNATSSSLAPLKSS